MAWTAAGRRVLLVVACLVGVSGFLFAGEEALPKGEAPKADYSSPKATFQTLMGMAKAGNREGVLACLDDETRKVFLELEKAIMEMCKDMPELKKEFGEGDLVMKMAEEAKKNPPQVGEEKIDGKKATLEVTSDGKKESMPFVNESGAWKMQFPGAPSPDEVKKSIEMMKATVKTMKEMKDKQKAEEKTKE